MTTAQVVETSVTVNNNSPIQDYIQLDNQTFVICTKLHQITPNCTKLHQAASNWTKLHQSAPKCTNLH